MSEPTLDLARCPACGAANAPDARWCGQCLHRFDAPEPPRGTVGDESASERPGFVRADGVLRWTCPACEAANPMEAAACVRCGSAFSSLFGAPRNPGPARASGKGALIASAIVPGAGHWLLGARAEAVARGVLYVWTLGLSVLLLVRPPGVGRGIVRGVAVIFGIAAAGVWLLSFLETARLAEGHRRALVPPRTLTYVASGLSGLLFAGLIVAAMAGR
jgi:ribosomal protein L40E